MITMKILRKYDLKNKFACIILDNLNLFDEKWKEYRDIEKLLDFAIWFFTEQVFYEIMYKTKKKNKKLFYDKRFREQVVFEIYLMLEMRRNKLKEILKQCL